MIWSLLTVGAAAIVGWGLVFWLSAQVDRLTTKATSDCQEIACLQVEVDGLRAQLGRSPAARNVQGRRSFDDHVADAHGLAGPDVVLSDEERAAFRKLRQQFHGGDD